MSGGSSGRLLLILMGVVPLVVLITVVIAFFLVRAGFGLLVGAGIPFVVATLAIVVLSVMLGRAAARSSGSSGSSGSQNGESGEDEGRSRSRDGV